MLPQNEGPNRPQQKLIDSSPTQSFVDFVVSSYYCGDPTCVSPSWMVTSCAIGSPSNERPKHGIDFTVVILICVYSTRANLNGSVRALSCSINYTMSEVVGWVGLVVRRKLH